MTSRLRNMIMVFGVSILMWVTIVHGTMLAYTGLAGSSTDTMTTASVSK
ncbi:hypothetical protein [Neorhizobium sp. NCHU2750]|nr:hypothetical protein NCHU2750_11610 [Neorhizobium sp. NCHU2750]